MTQKPDNPQGWRKTKLGWRSMPILLLLPVWASLSVLGAIVGWSAIFFFGGYHFAQEFMLKAREVTHD